MIYSWTYVILIPAMLFALYAQMQVKTAYKKYSRVRSASGMTGASTARALLDKAGLRGIDIGVVPGQLTDHYDPRRKALFLSKDIYYGDAIASLGIAAHEAGHAIQDGVGYNPMKLRAAIVPVANIGSSAAWPLFLIGLFFQNSMFMNIGILFFSFAVVFQVVTLPVEFNASKRAVVLLSENGIITGQESIMVKKVLSAAALTYVAATATAILQLLQLVIMRGERN